MEQISSKDSDGKDTMSADSSASNHQQCDHEKISQHMSISDSSTPKPCIEENFKVEVVVDVTSEKEEPELPPTMTRDEWKDEFVSILDDIDRKGDFCDFRDVTNFIPRFSPKISIEGMENGEHITFPLMEYQAKRIRSFAEKAPFGSGLNTVLDESVRDAWQIDASKVNFLDSLEWESALHKIVTECVASLGMNMEQQTNVVANLYKILLYEKGGHFMKHRDTEKEKGMFGTLIIQLPSTFSGGRLVIEHAKEKRTIDASVKSNEAFYASAFYSDCEHELLPVESGWRVCLAYNLVLQRTTDLNDLPSASSLMLQTNRLRKLSIHWFKSFKNAFGYVLEHDYTETNLHFYHLKGRDKEVANLLRGVRDVDGKPLFVVCLMLMSKHESGTASYDHYNSRRRYYDDDDDDDAGDHTMEEVHETEVDITHWIGPDDRILQSFQLDFDMDGDLLNSEDEDELFGEEPDKQEYEGYTGNAGPTLDYWYYRSSVVFWPRAMNMAIMKSAGVSYMLSYLQGASPSEQLDICRHIITLLENKRISMSTDLLQKVATYGDANVRSRVVKSCGTILNESYAQVLAGICITRLDDVETEILDLVTKTSRHGSNSLSLAFKFLQRINSQVPPEFYNTVRQRITTAALTSITNLQEMKVETIQLLTKACFEVGGDTFQTFVNTFKIHSRALSIALTHFISIGESAITNPLVIEMAIIRAEQLQKVTKQGPPAFSWRQPNANFTGSQSELVNAFLRSYNQSCTFRNFNGIDHARNWASKYFGGYGNGTGYSASASPGGRGRDAYVTVTKTKTAHWELVRQYKEKEAELGSLKEFFGNHLSHITNVIVDEPPNKKAREVIVLD